MRSYSTREWFSGKIQRCHRWAPSSILGSRILPFLVPPNLNRHNTVDANRFLYSLFHKVMTITIATEQCPKINTFLIGRVYRNLVMYPTRTCNLYYLVHSRSHFTFPAQSRRSCAPSLAKDCCRYRYLRPSSQQSRYTSFRSYRRRLA